MTLFICASLLILLTPTMVQEQGVRAQTISNPTLEDTLTNDYTYNLNAFGNNYPIRYNITGNGDNITSITRDGLFLLMNIASKVGGVLTIELPRDILDSKIGGADHPFEVSVDSLGTEYDESKNMKSRTLTISYDKGTRIIEIEGNTMLPSSIIENEAHKEKPYSTTDLIQSQLDNTNTELLTLILNDTIKDLKDNNTKSAVAHLHLARQQLSIVSNKSSSFKLVGVLVDDTIEDLQKGHTNAATVHLNLANHQLQNSKTNIIQGNETSSATGASNFLAYENSTHIGKNPFTPNIGIRMAYPSDWAVGKSDDCVSFNMTMPDNVDNSHPYLSVCAYMASINSVNDAEYGDNFYEQNMSDFTLVSLNTITLPNMLANDTFARNVVYTFTSNEGILDKSMEIQALKDGILYIITYTSKYDDYNNYLPMIQRMIDSLRITRPE
jgi:hypothetical protein